MFSTSNLFHAPFKICWLESYGHLAYIIWGGGGDWKMDLVLGGKGIKGERGNYSVVTFFFLSFQNKHAKFQVFFSNSLVKIDS